MSGRPLWPDDELSTSGVTFRAGRQFRRHAEPDPDRQRQLRLPRAAHDGPRHARADRFGIRSGGAGRRRTEWRGRHDAPTRPRCRPAARWSRSILRPASTGRAAPGSTRAASAPSAGAFVNTIDGNIQKQALILPPGAVGTLLGGQPITSQNANGAVFVSLSTLPVLVRANFDHARVWGVEFEGDVTVNRQIVGRRHVHLSRGRRHRHESVRRTSRAARRRRAASCGFALRRAGGRWWVQPYSLFAGTQSRLSSLDAGDRRTGAGRTRGQIQNFFRRGATVRGFVNAGRRRRRSAMPTTR